MFGHPELDRWTASKRGLSPAKSCECYAAVMPLHGVKTRAGHFFLLPLSPFRPRVLLPLDSESSTPKCKFLLSFYEKHFICKRYLQTYVLTQFVFEFVFDK